MIRRFGLLSVLAGFALSAVASPAGAGVTLGQLAPALPDSCNNNVDFVQFSLSSGTSYVVPEAGSITSWATKGNLDSGQQLTLKVFRKLAGPNTYQVVGHEGPRAIVPNTTAGNAFFANIPVKPGDILGVHSNSPFAPCAFAVPAADQIALAAASNIPDGDTGALIPSPGNTRINLTAVLQPSNTFTLGKAQLNKRKGTATLNLTLPNPGQLTGSGNGAKVASARAGVSKEVGAGQAKLVIKAKGKRKRKLNATGRVKLKVAVTYTPTGGDPSSQSVKVKLKKNL